MIALLGCLQRSLFKQVVDGILDLNKAAVSLGWHYHCCKHHRCTRSFNFTGLFATLKDFETQLSKAICSTHVLLGSETSEGGTTASIPAPLIVLAFPLHQAQF
jgi:hypothetical protein